MLRELIPIIAIVMTMAIPIVAILVHHQRRMAEMLHQNHVQSLQPSAEAQAMRHELLELRKRLNEQTIELDDLCSKLGARQTPPEIASRITN